MNENKKEIVYVNPIWIEEKKLENGNSFLKVSMLADKMIEFLQKNKNNKGYVRITINKRREIGSNGQTHYAALDTWQPSMNGEITTTRTIPVKQGTKKIESYTGNKTKPEDNAENDEFGL